MVPPLQLLNGLYHLSQLSNTKLENEEIKKFSSRAYFPATSPGCTVLLIVPTLFLHFAAFAHLHKNLEYELNI